MAHSFPLALAVVSPCNQANGGERRGLVCPSFECPEADATALRILQDTFPGREVVQVPGREILLVRTFEAWLLLHRVCFPLAACCLITASSPSMLHVEF